MEWTEDYIRRCLSGIPQSKYRERLQGELADHLAQLVEDVSRAGRSEAEAQAEALRQMGDADALNAACHAEWLRQPERRRCDRIWLVSGCLLASVGFLLAFALILLGALILGLFNPFAGAGLLPPPWSKSLPVLSGAFLYAAAFVPNAMFLRKSFRRRERRTALITAGLLLSWFIGKGSVLLFIIVVYGFPAIQGYSPLTGPFLEMGGKLLWFTWPFIAASLLGCAALGWLFGRDRHGEKKAVCHARFDPAGDAGQDQEKRS